MFTINFSTEIDIIGLELSAETVSFLKDNAFSLHIDTYAMLFTR